MSDPQEIAPANPTQEAANLETAPAVLTEEPATPREEPANPTAEPEPEETTTVANDLGMEEHFVLRVPQSVAERLERILNKDPDSRHDGLDLEFQDGGRLGTFRIGEDEFPASLLDLPEVVESYKTYDDNELFKAADIGQIIMVQEPGEPVLEGPEYEHGLTPAMRHARRRRFRPKPDSDPDFVKEVEIDLLSIKAGGIARGVEVETIVLEVTDSEGEELPPRNPAAAEASTAVGAAADEAGDVDDDSRSDDLTDEDEDEDDDDEDDDESPTSQ